MKSSEVKWPLGSITNNKASGGDGIPAELFQILKDDAVKVLTQSAHNVGDLDSIPHSGRSSGEGNGNPFQDSCLDNPMEGGTRWATVHGVPKSWTQLSDFTSLHTDNK